MNRALAAAVIVLGIIVLLVFVPAISRMSRRMDRAHEDALRLESELEEVRRRSAELDARLAESTEKAREMESLMEEYRVQVKKLEHMLEEASETGRIPAEEKVDSPRG